MRKVSSILIIGLSVIASSCEKIDHSGEKQTSQDTPWVSQEAVAMILSKLPLGSGQVGEVHDAVSASSDNGYDEEYTMSDLFREPGSGVGDAETRALGLKTEVLSYHSPLKDLISSYILENGVPATKSSPGIPVRSGDEGYSSGNEGFTPEDYLKALQSSDIQIYWPYSENWDGKTGPIITFDPEDGSSVNVGYRRRPDGTIETLMVDESLAQSNPVWVVNRNDDSYYESLEMLRRQDPDWGSTGGEIIIGKKSPRPTLACAPSATAPASLSKVKTLILKNIKVLRNFDPWFAGASEFFIKCGAVEDFTASTEAEMRLYTPQVTDFMIVVKRKEVGVEKPFNAVLVSDWTDQLESIAFMAAEDDGGTRTEWKCSGYVKIKSKSYGYEISLPLNVRDDIVWRGQLSSSYLDKYNNTEARFGDVILTFQFLEK